MVLKWFSIAQMRSTVVFRLNTPTTSATSDREAVTTGGQNDVYSNLLTTRGRLRKKNGKRSLDLGLLTGEDSYELICRFQSAINTGIQVNGKVFVDSIEYTIQPWEAIDQVGHWYKFELTCQTISGTIINLGPELITNGGFTGDASGWGLGGGWTYGGNKVSYSSSSKAQFISQNGTLINGNRYRISFNLTGTTGHMVVNFGSVPVAVYSAGAGDVTFDADWTSSANIIEFAPWSTFNGSIDNVSVKEIL